MGNQCSPSSDVSLEERYPLPKRYQCIKVVGNGASGVVLKCLDVYTQKLVAIKFPRGTRTLSKEANVMQLLMDHRLDKENIIKFHGQLSVSSCLVFDMCDLNLWEYINQNETPMPLYDIRAVIQQLATAFHALKKIGITHCDLKPNNIMVVNRYTKLLQVRLIDFGLAMQRGDVCRSKIIQVPAYRAPQPMLGLPFTEALDIWSLGSVMATMMFKCLLFPGHTDYENLIYMVDLLGLPPSHIIDAGLYSSQYFKKTKSNRWELKTPIDNIMDKRSYSFRSFEEAKKLNLCGKRRADKKGWAECVELLREMLRWDERGRITPAQILAHPFVAMGDGISSNGRQSPEPSSKPEPEPSPVQTAEFGQTENTSLTEKSEQKGIDAFQKGSGEKTESASTHQTKEDSSQADKEDGENKKFPFSHFCAWFKRTFSSCHNKVHVAN